MKCWERLMYWQLAGSNDLIVLDLLFHKKISRDFFSQLVL
jgi:hypothetical protein